MFNSTLKPVVDQPVFEWERFNPVTTAAGTVAVSDWYTSFLGNTARYAYVINAAASAYRYDTFSDSWDQIATPPAGVANTNCQCLSYNPTHGYFGRALGSGGGTNTIQMAALNGVTFIGYKIYIYAGTGAGQERTITGVADPLVADSGAVVSTTAVALGTPYAGVASAITDSNTGMTVKSWKYNQWRDYQVRFTVGTGANQIRRILYNGTNSLTFTDNNYSVFHGWGNAPLATIPVANATFYQIESSVVTVNSNWTVIPDNTSKFVIKSGAVWMFATGTNSNSAYGLNYYDPQADIWYLKDTQSALNIANSATDGVIETLGEQEGGATTNGIPATPLTNNKSTISVASAPLNTRTLIDAGQYMSINQYANHLLRLTGGTGAGQQRSIVANNATTFIIGRDWEVIPDSTTTYIVIGDSDKVYFLGGTGNPCGMQQYSVENNMATPGRQFDYGVARPIYALQNPYPIFSINTTPAAGGSGYVAGDVGATLTLTNNGFFTGSGGLATITSVNTGSGAVTGVSILSAGVGYPSSATAYATTGGTGTGAKITVSANNQVPQTPIGIATISRTGALSGISAINTTPVSAGSLYNINDLVSGSTGGTLGYFRVTGVGSNGAVTSVALEQPGSGYSTGTTSTAIVTTRNASASGLQISITAVADIATATTNFNHNLNLGDMLYIGGLDGASAEYFSGVTGNAPATVIGVPSATTFNYVILEGAGVPGGSAAAYCTINQTGAGALVYSNVIAGGLGYGYFNGSTYATGTGILTVSINNAGLRYQVGDLLLLTGAGTYYGIVKVTTITASTGAVTAVQIMSAGAGYATSTTYNTVNLGNITAQTSTYWATNGGTFGATNCTITVSAIGNMYSITGASGSNGTIGVTTVNSSTGAVTGAVVPTGCGGGSYISGTITLGGATGTVTATTGMGIIGGILSGGSPTAGFILSTTTLVDTYKNWQPNELVGKTLMIGLGGINATFQQRRIISNTAFTLSVGPVLTLPVSGTYKYVIHDPKPFGTESTNKYVPNMFAWGMATGSQGLLTVSVGSAGSGGSGYNIGDILSVGIYGGQVQVSSTSTGAVTGISITYPGSGYTASTNNVASTAITGTGSSCTVNVLTVTATYASPNSLALVDANPNKAWIPNQFVGKKLKIIAGTGVNAVPNEIPIVSNSTNTLFFPNQPTNATMPSYGLGFVPDGTTTYAIMDNWGTATSTGLSTVNFTAGGTNYAVGDVLLVIAPTNQGLVRVASVSSGVITAVYPLYPGGGYSVAAGQATVTITGNGASGTINVTAISAVSAANTINDLGVLSPAFGGANYGASVLIVKRCRAMGDIQGEAAISANTATQITAVVGTPTYNTQYGVLGVMSRVNPSLDRLFGTTVVNKCQFMVSFRGNATPTIDRYDICNDVWDYLTQSPLTETFTTGTMWEYDGKNRIYIQKDALGRLLVYDFSINKISNSSTIPYGMAAAVQGNKIFTMSTSDLWGANLAYIYVMRHSGQEFWRTLVFW